MKTYLNKLVSFCFDRFDCHIELANMLDLSEAEHKIETLRAGRWWDRAHDFAALRDARNGQFHVTQ
jgi:hypothetical protein